MIWYRTPAKNGAMKRPRYVGSKPHKAWRRIPPAAALIIGLFWGVAGVHGETGNPDTPQRTLTTAPRYVAIKIVNQQPAFIAGQTGEFQIDLYIANPTDTAGNTLSWHLGSEPATLRVAVPEQSGIRFEGGEADPQQVFALAVSTSNAGVISTRLPYSVSSRVSVKTYTLQLDISVPLSASDGGRIQDSGLITLPVRVDTPHGTKLLVLGVLAAAVLLFVVEWVRVDVVGILMMISLPMLNLLSSTATFTGLSSNAVVAIIGVMIISAGLNKVGLVSRAVKPLIAKAGSSPTRLMVFVASVIALISSVMQNTGAAVLFLPGVRHACRVMRIPISRVLMPIGMCAILGGTLTMIGTSPLILLNDILPEGMEKFGLLELTPIGCGLVIAGILYFATGGRFFLNRIAQAQSKRAGSGEGAGDISTEVPTFELYHGLAGPFELRVPEGWQHKRGPNTIAGIRREFNVNIVGLADDAGLYAMAPPPEAKLRSGQNLCVYGPEDSVKSFAEAYGIKLLDAPIRFRELFNLAVAGTVEAVVSPRSTLIGTTVRDVSFRKTFGVTVLALYRGGRTYYKENADIPLMSGDALLLHSTWEHFHRLQQAHQNFKIITPLEVDIQKPGKSTPAVICFSVSLTLMFISSFYFQKLPYNPIPLSVCLLTGALGMIVTRVISIQDAYQAIDLRTVFLLGGLIPLGMAVDRTGTAAWIATGVVTALGDSMTPFRSDCRPRMPQQRFLPGYLERGRVYPAGAARRFDGVSDRRGPPRRRHRGGVGGFKLVPAADPPGQRPLYGPGGLPYQRLS